MIHYRDTILENYFIDPETAIITNSKGEIQKTTINKDGRPYFKCMAIHKIQVHTYIGYKLVKIDSDIPEGFVRGRLKNEKRKI